MEHIFRTALLEAGFTPDDYYFDPEMDNTEQSILLLQNGQQQAVMGDSPDKMTYTEQANKRQHCKRLTAFIRLCDYLITNTMHSLGKILVLTLRIL